MATLLVLLVTMVVYCLCSFTSAVEIGWDNPSRDVLDTAATKLVYFQKDPWYFCEHQASCGHYYDMGPAVTSQYRENSGNGDECYCYGVNPINGQIEDHCYIGHCDYGAAHTDMHGSIQDQLSDFTMTRVTKLDPTASAENEGLCKYRRLIDNIVDAKLCERHTTPGTKFDIIYPQDSPFMEPSLKEYFLEFKPSTSASDLPSTLEERIEALMHPKHSVVERIREEELHADMEAGLPDGGRSESSPGD